VSNSIESYIRDIPDFPKPGIVFKDITPLLASPKGLKLSVDMLAELVDPDSYDIIAGIESRGFIFGVPLATMLGKGFVPIRKPGKLPFTTESVTYELEYGTDTVEIHTDALDGNPRVLIVDDLLATGGTMAAAAELIRKIGGVPVAAALVIELSFLPGRAKLGDLPVHSLITF
jgi:adenine phosphoribosyltransferase